MDKIQVEQSATMNGNGASCTDEVPNQKNRAPTAVETNETETTQRKITRGITRIAADAPRTAQDRNRVQQ